MINIDNIDNQNALNKFLLSCDTTQVLMDAASILAIAIPEIQPMFGFNQNNPHHHLDVWEHTMAAVAAIPAGHPDTAILRLIMLFHDIGKPHTYTEDEDGIGHFYGHPKVSADIAREILLRLHYDSATIETTTQLILFHDIQIEARRKIIKRRLNRFGEEQLRRLLHIKTADAMAQSPQYRQAKLDLINNVLPIIDSIIAQQR